MKIRNYENVLLLPDVIPILNFIFTFIGIIHGCFTFLYVFTAVSLLLYPSIKIILSYFML